MEQSKGHQQENAHQHDLARRDDLLWTQLLTTAAKLPPPKSQTLTVLERYLTDLNEKLIGRGESRLKERLAGDADSSLESDVENSSSPRKNNGASQNGLASELNEVNVLNSDSEMVELSPLLGVGAADIEKFSFSDGREVGRPASEVQRLQQEIVTGARWVEVLWQFIATHQKRVIDLDRLGVEPSERMDIQVDLIRQLAASYEKLGLLTRLPDSLSEARDCKVTDDIRTMALVYVARTMMDVASPDEIADAEDGKNKKQDIEFPRSVLKPYECIQPIEFDPAELLGAV